MLPGLHKPPEEMRKAESCSHPGAAARGLGAGDPTGSVTVWEWVLGSVPFIPTSSQVALAPPGSALPFVPGEHTVLFQKVRLLLACAGACGASSALQQAFKRAVYNWAGFWPAAGVALKSPILVLRLLGGFRSGPL